MADIQVGAAIGAGFGLIRRRPVSVIVWGLGPTLLQIAAVAIIGPSYIQFLHGIVQNAAAGGAARPDPAAMSGILRMEAAIQLLNLMQLLVAAVVYCAVFRAVIHPERSRFAYMRVTAPELMLMAVIFGALIAFVVAMAVLAIPIGIAFGVAIASAPASQASYAVLLPLILILLSFAIMIYFGLRFAFIGPMMVDDNRFHFIESWRLTKGRMGSLLLIGLALLGIFIVVEIVLLAVMFGVGAALLTQLGGFARLQSFLAQPPDAMLRAVWPYALVYAVLLSPLSGSAVAIAGAPFARAYEDVKARAAAVFA